MKKQKITSEALYALTVPVLIRSLTNLLVLIRKGEKFAKKKRLSNKKLFASRLSPDMYHFGQQVQYAYFLALDIAGNLSSKPPPVFKYDETTTAELSRSVRRTLAYLKGIKLAHYKGAMKKRVPVFWNKKQKLPALAYLQTLGIPDFFFHYTTAYDILRHLGVGIGKDDFIGPF